MDWLEEKADGFLSYVRNLSFRKAMIAYILVLAFIVWGLSYITMIFCRQWEMSIWAEYGETENLKDIIYEKRLLFFDILRVWCPFFYNIQKIFQSSLDFLHFL